jgi:hypothetical protein
MKRFSISLLLILLSFLLSAAMPFPGPHDTPAPYPPSPIEGETIPLFVTGYSWNQDVDPMGCDSDCSVTAIGWPTEDRFLGVIAACPAEWVYLDMVMYVYIEGWGGVWCADVLGSPEYREIRWMTGVGWVYHVDLALKDPYTAPYGLTYDYTLRWSFTYEISCYSCME